MASIEHDTYALFSHPCVGMDSALNNTQAQARALALGGLRLKVYWVHILVSDRNGAIYTGVTGDLIDCVYTKTARKSFFRARF